MYKNIELHIKFEISSDQCSSYHKPICYWYTDMVKNSYCLRFKHSKRNIKLITVNGIAFDV